MTPDEQLLVIFGGLHVIALVLGGILFVMFLRSDGASKWTPPDDDDQGGGGGNDRVFGRPPKTSPSGGIPLPDAVQSIVRLRTRHDHLVEPSRRPVPPRRTPERIPNRPLVPSR